ncbi:hypothetical protein ACI3QN_13960, partial [Propionibacterium freudenreichii]|uniref:hypothetical protein n=1 Tax=Propionibacterium freudenreichii TaxID=1744 RepID=UPI0038535E47
PKIIVTKGFKFAHHGYQVQEFEAGPEPIETTEEVAKWVVEHQHGKKAKKSSAADTAAQDALRVRIAELEPLLASAT